jgi:hypothetical protein
MNMQTPLGEPRCPNCNALLDLFAVLSLPSQFPGERVDVHCGSCGELFMQVLQCGGCETVTFFGEETPPDISRSHCSGCGRTARDIRSFSV